MTATLFIRVREDLDAPVTWQLAEGAVADAPVHHTALNEVRIPDTGGNVVILAPGVCVTLAEAQIPSRNRAQLLKAVPYALEEELAESVDELHFAINPKRGAPTLVGVVKREWLEGLLGRLKSLGLTPGAVVPETLCLPWREGEWTLLVEDTGVLMRTGTVFGLAADADNMGALLEAMRSVDETQAPAVRVFDRRKGHQAAVEPVEWFQDEGLVLDNSAIPALSLMTREYLARRPLNLLQGDFAVASDWRSGWSRWRLAALLAALAVMAHLIGIGLDNQRLAARKEVLDSAMTAVYREVFPEAERVINPAVEMRNRLRMLREQAGGESVGVLDLLAVAGSHLLSDQQVTLKQLRYRNGRLELDVEAPSIERLEAMQQRLRAARLNAELPAVTSEGKGFQGRIVVSAVSS